VEGTFTQAYKATIGADFSTRDMTVEGQTVGLQIWDTAGQERFQSLGGSFYKGADCCAIVFDLTKGDTFVDVAGWHREFLQHEGSKDGETFPFVLIGNQADRTDARRVPQAKIQSWCKAMGNIPYFETSAKDGSGVPEAFQQLANIGFKSKKQLA
jgi:Ras-related protein Rab-7A